MATVLLAWELGGGLGHMVPLRCLGQALIRRGHEVVAVLRDLSSAAAVFQGTGIDYLQAPVKIRAAEDRISPLLSAAHILHNTGFANADELGSLVHAWTTLFNVLKPDIVVADHAPTALLALRGYRAKATALAMGFNCPPDTTPLPPFLQELPCDLKQLASDEGRVLNSINAVLGVMGRPPIDRLARLFHDLEETFLVTFAELDHYGPRPEARYWGPWWESVGRQVEWPSGAGPRIFAYLRPFLALPAMLDALRQSRLPAVVVLERPGGDLLKRFACPTLRIETQPVDISYAARHCDLAILNAGHGTTAAMLLAGKPILEIPLLVEQAMVARCVERIGAGILAPAKEPQQLLIALEQMLSVGRYASAAQQFSARHCGYEPRQSIEAVAQRIEQLLER